MIKYLFYIIYCGHDSRGNETSRDDIPLIMEKYNQYIENGDIERNHLGFVITEKDIRNNVYVPKYYNPEIEETLNSLKVTHTIVSNALFTRIAIGKLPHRLSLLLY